MALVSLKVDKAHIMKASRAREAILEGLQLAECLVMVLFTDLCSNFSQNYVCGLTASPLLVGKYSRRSRSGAILDTH